VLGGVAWGCGLFMSFMYSVSDSMDSVVVRLPAGSAGEQ